MQEQCFLEWAIHKRAFLIADTHVEWSAVARKTLAHAESTLFLAFEYRRSADLRPAGIRWEDIVHVSRFAACYRFECFELLFDIHTLAFIQFLETTLYCNHSRFRTITSATIIIYGIHIIDILAIYRLAVIDIVTGVACGSFESIRIIKLNRWHLRLVLHDGSHRLRIHHFRIWCVSIRRKSTLEFFNSIIGLLRELVLRL